MPRPRLAAGLVGAGALAATLVLVVPQHRTDGIDFTAAAAPPTDAGATPAGAAADTTTSKQRPNGLYHFAVWRRDGVGQCLSDRKCIFQ